MDDSFGIGRSDRFHDFGLLQLQLRGFRSIATVIVYRVFAIWSDERSSRRKRMPTRPGSDTDLTPEAIEVLKGITDATEVLRAFDLADAPPAAVFEAD